MEFFRNLLGFTNQVGGSLKVGDRVVEKFNHKHGAITLIYQREDRTLFRMTADDGEIQDRSEENFAIESEWEAERLYMEAERARERERERGERKLVGNWKINEKYRNKFTGMEGTIKEEIETHVWMCIEEGKYICLHEVEMIPVSDPIPFITNFKGDHVKLKANDNYSIDFIIEIFDDYISRVARITIEDNLLSKDELRRIGDECSKPFSERKLENIVHIKILSLLNTRYISMIDMLKDWAIFDWFKFRKYYETNIIRKGGGEFNKTTFILYIINVFYNRVTAIMNFSQGCIDANSLELSPLSLSSEEPSSRRTPFATPSALPSTLPSAIRFALPSALPSATRFAIPSALPSATRFALPSAIPSATRFALPSTTRGVVEAERVSRAGDDIVGVSKSFICPALELFSIKNHSFETTTVSSKYLGVPLMEAPAIYWEMVGKHVLTDIDSLRLFKFDKYGKSAFQDDFFTKYDIRITGCFKNGIPCICIEGGKKIVAFAHWVIANRERHRLRHILKLEIEGLGFYSVFRETYSDSKDICLVINRLYSEVHHKMRESSFKQLVKLSYEECLLEESRPITIRLPMVREESDSVSSSASVLLEASRRHPSVSSTLSFSSLLHPSLRHGEERRVLEVPRGPFEVPRGPFEASRGPFEASRERRMSLKPVNLVRPTSTEEDCNTLSGVAADRCRLKQSFFDSIPTRRG